MPCVSPPQNFLTFTNKINVPAEKGFNYWIRSITSALSLPNITSICLKAFDSLQKTVENSLYPIKLLKNWVFTKFSKEGSVHSPTPKFVTEEELQQAKKNLNSTNPEIPPETPRPPSEMPSNPPSEQPSKPIPEQPSTPDPKTPEWLSTESPDNTTPPKLKSRFPRSDSVKTAYLGGAIKMRARCKPTAGDETEDSQQIQLSVPVLTKEQIKTENQENDPVNTPNLPRPVPVFLKDIGKPHTLRNTPKRKKTDPAVACFNINMINQCQSTPNVSPGVSSPCLDSWSE